MTVEFPEGPFDVVAADPPWQYQKTVKEKREHVGRGSYAEHSYPTMPNEDIAALPVADLAAPDAHLFMWVTNPGMYGGRFSTLTPHEIAARWGFQYRTMLTWVKTTKTGEPNRGGMGWYFRGCTEHVLYATRGKAKIPSALRQPNVLLAPTLGHSVKPPEFYTMVEHVTPGARRLEMFARRPREHWTTWGNQAEQCPTCKGSRVIDTASGLAPCPDCEALMSHIVRDDARSAPEGLW